MTITVLILCTCVAFSAALPAKNDGLSNYFESPEGSLFQLDILSEYKVERYVFPVELPHSEDSVESGEEEDGTVLYRILGGPKSPPAVGKRPALIQHGVLCDVGPCSVNKPLIAIVYLLADQSYDVWLGISNSSMAVNSSSSEVLERKRLENVAQYILATTQQPELLVMGYFNGSVQFFGIAAEGSVKEPSRFSKWFEKIPGVKVAKKWYNKIYARGRSYLTRGYDRVVESFDNLGRKFDYITDDQSIRKLKDLVLNAWGFVTVKVAPTLTVQDFSNMINHPDVYLDTPQLVAKYGYNIETHEVKTADGYILSLHRVSGGKRHPPRPGKPAILLQHGLLASSAVWVLAGPSKGLAYILADEGYDVWMGNSRGSTYSRMHEYLLTTDSQYWDFSWHEMGIYDLPATIDHILAVTGNQRIYYLGHSQGTTSFFVMMSERPEYNDKVIKFAAHAPLAYTAHMRSPVIKFLSKIARPIYHTLQFLKINNFAPKNALLVKLGRDSCEARSLYQVVCSNSLFMVTGYDTAQMNKTLVPVILGHLPAGSSIKQLLHFSQGVNSKKFQQFDYKNSEKNREKYGQPVPPQYNISNTKVPVGLFYASNDLLSDPRDVLQLEQELPNVEMQYKVPMELFNHLDFMFAIDAPALIYQPTIDFLKSPQNATTDN